MGSPPFHRLGIGVALAAILVLAQGCAVLPFYKNFNREMKAEPVGPVGSYNASLNVPWDYDFTRVSEERAARCRQFVVTGVKPAGAAKDPCEGIPRDDNFVALALSGGGSRSAALSAAIMWELNRLGILKHVDVISGVSGGSQAAAFYALTRDPADTPPFRHERERYVLDPTKPERFVGLFERNLTEDWALSLLTPWHLAAYSLTFFDRTDVMADTLSDNYYPRGAWYDINWGMRFRDLNPKRPNLLLNAVDMTMLLHNHDVPQGIAGKCFPIVYETLRNRLGSDFHQFPIAQAAMASSAYPALFQYVSLRNFKRKRKDHKPVFVHLADGGIRDHLALVPINAMLRRFAEGRSLAGLRYEDVLQSCDVSRGSLNPERADSRRAPAEGVRSDAGKAPRLPKKILVIVIDSAKPPTGTEETRADPRTSLLFDLAIPISNVIDTIDTTLDDQRILRVAELVRIRKYLTGKNNIEKALVRCLHRNPETMEAVAKCVAEIERPLSGKHNGVLGAACCPVIGFGVHDFTKYASDEFGPIKRTDTDSDKIWGMNEIALECLPDNDYGRGKLDSLYSRVRSMSIGLSLTHDQVEILQRSARALTDEMVSEFCDPKTHWLAGVEGIACKPRAKANTEICRN